MKMRAMFLVFVAMVALITPSIARGFPTRSLVDTYDENLQQLYASHVNLELGIDDKNVPIFEIAPSNAPESTPVPEPAHKHKHKHEHKEHQHKHEHEPKEHHHKHEHKDHHHKHEHKDHHHKHNAHHGSQAMAPNAPVAAPAQSLQSSFWMWLW